MSSHDSRVSLTPFGCPEWSAVVFSTISPFCADTAYCAGKRDAQQRQQPVRSGRSLSILHTLRSMCVSYGCHRRLSNSLQRSQVLTLPADNKSQLPLGNMLKVSVFSHASNLAQVTLIWEVASAWGRIAVVTFACGCHAFG